MAVNRGEVGSAPRLAALLLDDVDRLAEHAAGRMQKLLPSYAKVPRAQLVPIVRTNMRNVLEAIRDPAADTRRAQANFHTSGRRARTRASRATRCSTGGGSPRTACTSTRDAIVDEHALGADAMLAFLEAMLRWNDAGMRASAEAHRKAELRELTRLAAEQAALRRVATMVAHGSSPEQIFVKVAEEVGQLLGVQAAAIHRYEHDEDTIVGSWGTVREAVVVRCAIIVNGRPWGALDIATAEPDAMPASAESRLNAFTELVATAIANAQARADLAASRARVVAAADEERRRVVRDLHDGAQQRLVLAVMTLERARGALEHRGPDAVPLLDEALRHAETATDDLRELAHGILPSVLAHAACWPACARSQPGCRSRRDRRHRRAPVRRRRGRRLLHHRRGPDERPQTRRRPSCRRHRARERRRAPPQRARRRVGGADSAGSGIVGLATASPPSAAR